MHWIILVIAGLFEVGWAVGLKYTYGFTRFWPSVATSIAMVISLVLLGLAMKSLPAGSAYAIWVGIGIVGTTAAGIFLFQEPASLFKIISVLLILAGVVGLKLSTTPV